MNIKGYFIRNEEKEELKVFESWEVRWNSRHGEYSSDTRPEAMMFPSKEHAEKFKEALVCAFKLIKCTSGTKVTIKGRNYD